MQGVLVSAVSVSGSAINAYTDAYGNYSLSVGPGYFVVNAVKQGYMTGGTGGPQGVTFSPIAGGQQISNVNFTLYPNTTSTSASLYVLVSGTASTLLHGANINIEGNDATTTGYTASAVTDANGGVTITGIPAGGYNINLTAFGYQLINTTTTAPNSLGFVMTAVTAAQQGTISGMVTSSGNPLSGVTISIYAQSVTYPAYTATTAAGGTYSLTADEGNYVVTAMKNNFVSSPAQAYADVTPLGAATANFTMAQPQGGGITISAPSGASDIIYNENLTGPYKFSATYVDGSGAVVPVTFAWSVTPSAAGTIDATGVYLPTVDYIGQVTVIATALGQSSGTTALVWQKLTPSWPAADKTVRDYQGFSLVLPAGCADPSNTIDRITLNKVVPSSQRTMTKNGMVIGDIYDLTNGFKFTNPVTMTLPLPSGYDTSSAQIGAWDTVNLKWQTVTGSSTSNNEITSGIGSLCQYAVIIPLQPLGFANVTMLPNPFSPYRGGLTINYVLESKEGSSIITTIKIYNMAGKLIRTLVDRQQRGAGVINTLTWDGKDKDGKVGVNGRYILQLQIEDASGTKQALYSIVLIK